MDASLAFDHFHVIRVMKNFLRRMRSKDSRYNETLKHTRYNLLKNHARLGERQKDCILSKKKLDPQTAYVCPFKIALQRLLFLNLESESQDPTT